MPATDELSVLGGASRYLLTTILSIRDTDLCAATPCQDWDLGYLLRHVHASVEQFTDMLATHGHGDDLGAQFVRRLEANPVAALRASLVDLLLVATALPISGRWCEIWGRILPAKIVVYVAALEIALHAWDIAQACETDSPIPADVATALLGVARPLAEAGAAQQVFAQPVDVSATATPSDRLLALFGRQPIPQPSRLDRRRPSSH